MSHEGAGRFVHPTAVVEDGAEIGEATQIWHFAHVRAGARIGSATIIGKSVYVGDGAVIGDGCKVQNFVSVYSGVTLADEVFVGPSAVFTNDLVPRASGNWELAQTRVERGASIGANSTILCGLTIGQWAMIGAGSVVTSDVAAHRLVVGNPAHPIGWVCQCGHRVDGVGSICDACGTLLRLD